MEPNASGEADPSSVTLTTIERLAARLTAAVICGATADVAALQRELSEAGAPAWLAAALVAAPDWPVVDDDRLAAVTTYVGAVARATDSRPALELDRLRVFGMTTIDLFELTVAATSYRAASTSAPTPGEARPSAHPRRLVP